jgi:hypothetical protein
LKPERPDGALISLAAVLPMAVSYRANMPVLTKAQEGPLKEEYPKTLTEHACQRPRSGRRWQ